MEEEVPTDSTVLRLSNYQDLVQMLNRSLEKLYEIFYSLYKDYNMNTRFGTKSKKYYLILGNLLWYNLQLISLTYPKKSLEVNDDYPGFSAVIQATRLDYLCDLFEFRVVFYYITVFCILVPFCSIIFCFTKLCNNHKIKGGNYKYLISIPLSLLNSSLYPSFLCIHLASIQKSFSSYPAYYDKQEIDISRSESNYTGPLSIVLLPILYLLVYIEIIFNYEQFPSRTNTIITSRSCSNFEVKRHKIVTGVCCLYILLGDEYFNLFLLVSSAMGGMLCYVYLYYLPFYNNMLNFGYAFAFAGLALAGLAQFAAYELNEAGLVFNTISFILPAIGVILYDFILRRVRYVKSNYRTSFSSLENINLCELAIRQEIFELIKANKNKDRETIVEIKKLIETMYCNLNQRFNRNNLLYIWEFVYSYNVLKEENLSRIKLSHALDGEFDLEYSYLYYKYIKLLHHFSFNYSEEVDYSNFLIMLHNARHADKETCYSQLEFWSELSKPFPNVQKLEQLSYKLYHDIYDNYRKCRKIHKKYPDNTQASKLYGTFLTDIYNDSETGMKVLSKVDHPVLENNHKRALRGHLSYFDMSHGCMIISGDPDSRGCIKYLNNEAAEMLGESLTMCINNHVCNYCPVPMNNKSYYDRTLVVYLQSRKYTNIPIPSLTYMIDSERYLFELFLKVHCVAIDSYPFFLAIMSKVTRPRGCALLSSDFIIENHSREFPIIIGYSEDSKQMAGLHIKEVIYNFDEILQGVENNSVIQYLNPLNFIMVYLKLDIFFIKTVSFRALYATTLKSEAMRWDELKTQRNDYVEDNSEVMELKLKKDRGIKYPGRSILKKNRIGYKNVKSNVTFAPHPYLYELENTDFAPGNTNCAEAKDAHVLFRRKSSIIEESEAEVILSTTNTVLSPTNKAQVTFRNHVEIEGNTINLGKETSKKSINSQTSSHSSSNFNTTARGKALITTLNNSVRSFKISYFISLLAVTISVLSIIIYIFTTSKSFQESIAAIQLSEVRTQTLQSSQSARITYLSKVSNFFSSDNEKESFLSTYYNLSSSYENTLDEIASKSKSWKYSTRKYYNDKTVSVWYQTDTSTYSNDINLVDAMKSITKSSYDLIAKDQSSLEISDPDLYFAFRNGHSETLKVLNETVVTCMEKAREDLDGFVTVVQVLSGVALSVLLICFFAIILPAILKVEKSNQNIWNFFFRLNYETLIELRGNIEDRLSNIHDERIDENMYQFSKFTSKSRNNIKSRRKWVNMMIKLLISYAISLGFLGFFYYWIIYKYISLLNTKVLLANWSGLRTLSLHSSYFWYLELVLANSNFSYFNIVPQYQSLTSLQQELDNSLDLLDYSNFLLIYGDLSDSGIDNTHSNIIYQDARSSITNSPHLSKGVHSALLDFKISLLSNPLDIPSSRVIYDQKVEIGKVLEDLELRYKDCIENELYDSEFMLLWATGSYILLMFLFYLILYIPSINNIKQQVTRVWDISRLIPMEFVSSKQKKDLY